ncbi:MAG: 2-amino-4-hydroxy-6-hydroxymethyldihydropteridine diphosphokinase, partial [Candidatus Omnitrophica bacterium]|nr:2-amino-4-hydroxy-6-hydroxymethyldihydropteridine diphosphokinase [Candidatus Omnitrophota bacterium]
EHMNDGDLVIPHPKIREREFVLKGLRELGIK